MSPASKLPMALLLLTTALLLSAPQQLAGQPVLPEEHQRIEFLVGEWHTTSEFPDGSTAEGSLRYEWVLEGAWMRVEFHGDRPGGANWESHVMQRWNADEALYEAWVFGAGGPPLRYTGTSEAPGQYRIEAPTDSGVRSGIDYHRQEDGSVYQENWVVENGTRRVTLRTNYRPAP